MLAQNQPLHNHCGLDRSRPRSLCVQRSIRHPGKLGATRHGAAAAAGRRAANTLCRAAAPSTEGSPAPAGVSRRLALSVAAGLSLWATELPAWALRTIELKDGTLAEVYEHGMTLTIVALRGSIPEQWLLEFRQALGRYAGLELGQRGQLQELFDELGKPQEKKSAGIADVVTLGDAWLAPAIKRQLVQPIPSAETYRWWRRLPPRWQALVRRDAATGLLTDSGPIWGCPYRWGGILLAFKREPLTRHGRHAIITWSDLLQPGLTGRIAFPDNPREFVGITLKTLGIPGIGFNSTESDLAAAGISRDTARKRLRALRSQARLFSSQEHVRALLAGDVLVTIGSSTDLVPLSERTPSVDLIAPADGTSLWADIWAVPAAAQHGHLQAGPSPILPSWLEFCISPARTESLSGLKTGASPLLLPPAAGALQQHPHHNDPAAAAAAAAPPTSSSSWLSKLWHKEPPGHQDSSRQQQQQLLLEAEQQQQEKQQLLYSAAGQLTSEDLKLTQAADFLPPESVLQLSEFMLPLDSSTLEFYMWLLS